MGKRWEQSSLDTKFSAVGASCSAGLLVGLWRGVSRYRDPSIPSPKYVKARFNRLTLFVGSSVWYYVSRLGLSMFVYKTIEEHLEDRFDLSQLGAKTASGSGTGLLTGAWR